MVTIGKKPVVSSASINDNISTLTSTYSSAKLASMFGDMMRYADKKQTDVINGKERGLSGSGTTTTGSIAAGTNVLTVASVESFEVGQYIAVDTAAKENYLSFVKVLTKPTQAGILTISSGDVSANYNMDAKVQIFDLTLTGTVTTTKQFGISLEWATQYVTLYAGETAATVATRIVTDLPDFWPGWTITNPSSGAIRFTSQTPGERRWGTQTFAYESSFYGTFTEVQIGTGSIGSAKGSIEWGADLTGWTKWGVDDYTVAFQCSTPGPQTDLTYSAGSTGVTLQITPVKTGRGELITKILAVDTTTKTLTLETNADFTVSGVTVRHDETSVLQSIVDEIFEKGGGKLYLPDGNYRITRWYMRDGVEIIGAGKHATTLTSHEYVWPTMKSIGEGSAYPTTSGDPRNEYIDTWSIQSLTVTTAYTGKASDMPSTKIALEMFLNHTVIVRDVNVQKHYTGIIERCSWYMHFENVKVENCHNGWMAPYFIVSATPSNHYNVVIKDNSGIGLYLDSVDIFNFIGGALERNAGGGIKIVGGQTRTVTFDTVNIEANGGVPVEIGDLSGNAPQGIVFRACSFKNWDSTKQDVAIKCNRAVGLEIEAPKFFNYVTAIDVSSGNTSFKVTNPSFDGCTNQFAFEGGLYNSGYFLSIIGDWSGAIGQTSTGWTQIFPTTGTLDIATMIALASGSDTSGTPAWVKRGYVNAKIDFGAVGDRTAVGVGTDDTTALQNALNAATTLRLPCFIPPGNYRITAGLVADSSLSGSDGEKNVMIYGSGGTSTRIYPDGYTYPALTIMNGYSSTGGGNASGIAVSGYVKDLYIAGSTTNPTSVLSTAGLLLRGMRQFEVHGITIRNMPIGFDMVDNCYGAVYFSCRTVNCTLALNLRTGSISGSDMNFYNMWFTGNAASIYMSPGAGGWHFFGGQISGGAARTAADTDSGAVVIGKDYLTSEVGGVGNIIFDGIDFEGIRYMHAFRSFGEITMTVRNCSFLQTATDTTAAPLSIWTGTGVTQSKVLFENNGLKGAWKASTFISIAGFGSLVEIHERGTYYSSNVTIGGVAWKDQPMVVQSKVTQAHAHWRYNWNARWLTGGIMYRESAGAVHQSVDWGTTWTGYVTSSLTANTSVTIGGGTPVTLIKSTTLSAYSLLSAIPTLIIPAHSSIDVPITYSGVVALDDVRVFIDNMPGGLSYREFCDTADTVTVRIVNITGTDITIPESHNIRITVHKFG